MTAKLNLTCPAILVLVLYLVLPAQAVNTDSLRNKVNNSRIDSGTVNAYIELSKLSLNTSYDSSIYYARKAVNVAEKVDFPSGQASGLLRLGNAYNFKGEYDSAAIAYKKAFNIFKERDEKLNMARALNNLGLMHRYMADYPKAVEYFMQSLDIKKVHGSPVDLGVVYQNIGVVFAIQGEYQTAEKYIDKAVKLYRDGGDSAKYYSSLIDISSLYRDQGRYEKSLKILTKTLAYHRRGGNKTSMAICIYNMGVVHYSNKDYDLGLEYYKEALTVFTELGNKVRMTGCNIRIADMYLELGKLAMANNYAQDGLSIAKTIGSPVQEYKLLELLSDIRQKQGNYKEALGYRIDFERLKDSINNEEHNLKMVKLQTRYQQEINKREIAELTAENDKSELRARKKAIENYILIGITILVILLMLMIYGRYVIKQKTNTVLRDKNQIIQHSLDEKEVLLREIHHRVQNNLQFVSSMLSLQARRVDDQNTLDILKDCKLRIQSMALVHQKLYQENSLQGINIYNYAQNLLESLIKSYHIDTNIVKTKLEIDPILLDINTAIPIGLILNELITNAFKYAFNPGSEGVLTIGLKEHHDMLILEVGDNGKGLDKDFNIEETNSFGLKLVKSLAQKLKAELSVSQENGTLVRLKIKAYEKM